MLITKLYGLREFSELDLSKRSSMCQSKRIQTKHKFFVSNLHGASFSLLFTSRHPSSMSVRQCHTRNSNPIWNPCMKPWETHHPIITPLIKIRKITYLSNDG